MKPTRTDFARAFLRSFAVQASWNYGTFQAGGLAYALLPLLRRIHGGDPEERRASMARALEPFNAHPYLTPMAAGIVARMEHDGAAGDAVRRLRRVVQGPLGALGDRIVWAGWRPFCLLSAVIAHMLGVGPWTSVLLFLVSYNAGHLALRLWAFRRGWREGPSALEGLSSGWPGRLGRALGRAAVGLAAGAAVVVAWELPGAGGLPSAALAGAAAAAGFRWPEVAGRLAVPLAAAALVAARAGGAV